MIKKQSNNKKPVVSELKKSLLSAKKSFIMVGLFSMFINILMLVPPLYMLQLYDRVLGSRSQDTLIMLTLIVVVLFITMGLLEVVRSRVLVRVGNKLDSMLSQRIFDSLFELERKAPGRSSSMPLNDLTQVRQFMTGNGLFAFFDAPWMPIYIIVLFIFHPAFGFFAIFAAIVLVGITIANEYSTKDKLAEANNLSRASTIYVDSNIRNAEVVNAMGMRNNISKVWADKYFGFLNAQNIASDSAGVWSNLSKSLRVMFQSLILGLGAYLAINMEVTPGMMIAASIIMGRALAPLDLIIGSWKGFSSARSSYERIEGLLNDFPKDKEYMQLPAPKGEITLENVVVIPPSGTVPSLKGISMKIEKGDVVGIIGPSAAGKSSLARVMLGLWPLSNGVARIDKADISQWDREDLGKYVGYLPQDIELFEGTVSQNIARFGEVEPEKVVEAASKAGVHEMILKLNEGYDTKIGPGGASLSGGQRQRIGLARALYNNPVFVVLDEPNSNLDDVGEAALVEAIKTLRAGGTTVVIITHRTNVLQATNKLALINNGVLELYGNTNDVLNAIAQKQQAAAGQAQAQAQAQRPAAAQSVVPKINLSKPSN
ncbi:type I secretion system permease/ATPase [Aliarcobacter cryaerophilus]|uniref:Type I secretion system permease/ATPase n=2 Tax=unclassified Arcobacter TaxID=2593671 RepID=A0AA96CZQ0_9BACT|nr:type I secretion system permease/ATPase [Arcobacter sp. AZ-2023]WPD10828.1 type I secretion system permease/ATPase [Arcobacter sp. DSM 115954]WNL15659.1 type I secretion system permease/ATPase [Arcobacter sp. AZ-2023]WNL18460.1 type I secretion system permease/ATPase [Arcobacter sp. AZ-2023]WNL20595.1 type I secretion system permease/ATPase [Arcobacter sp. AZ-2023]